MKEKIETLKKELVAAEMMRNCYYPGTPSFFGWNKKMDTIEVRIFSLKLKEV